eukprot:1722208-Amphidinium_carterae.3
MAAGVCKSKFTSRRLEGCHVYAADPWRHALLARAQLRAQGPSLRDIKPENFLLQSKDPDAPIKVSSWPTAQLSSNFTHEHIIVPLVLHL